MNSYSHLTTTELLRFIDSKRYYSPLINELCLRLEKSPDSCPICHADLIKYSKENGYDNSYE